MGIFSVKQPKNGAATDLFSLNPSTPPQMPASEPTYTATMETPPSSSKLSIRSPTPVPICPLPSLNLHQPTINVSMSTSTSKVIRPTASRTGLNPRDARPASTFDLSSRFPTTPHLPDIWTPKHDHAICVLDSLNYSLSAIIKKLRSAFPELEGVTLSPVMIDKRLRCLDQNPEIEYFRTGIEFEKDEKDMEGAKGMERAALGGGWDMRIPPDPRVSTLTQQVDESEVSLSALMSDDGENREDRRGSGSEVFGLARSDTGTVVRSEKFETGFLSYRTNTGGEHNTKKV